MDRKRQSFIFSSLAHFSNDGYTYVYSFLITYYIFLPGAKLAILGGLAIIYQIVNGLVSRPMGRLVDRMDRDSLFIALGLVLQGIAVVLFTVPFLNPALLYYVLPFAMIVLGVGQTFYHPIGASILSHTYSGGKTASVIGLNGSFGSIGRATMPAIMVGAVAIFGKVYGVSVIAIYGLSVSLIVYTGLKFFRRSDYPEKKIGAKKEGIKSEKVSSSNPVRNYSKYILILTAAVFLKSMMARGIAPFIPEYVKEVSGSEAIMTLLIASGLLISAFGQPIFGRLVSAKGGKVAVTLTTVVTVILYFVFLYSRSDFPVMSVTYVIFAFFNFSGFAIFLGYVSQIVPKSVSTTSNSTVWGVGQVLGGAAGTGVMSGLILFFPLNLSLWFMIFFGLGTIALLPFLPSKKTLARERAADVTS